MLYKAVVTYVKAHESELSPQQMTQLMEAIRWIWIPTKHLTKVMHNPLVPKDMLIQSLIARVDMLEHPDIPWAPTDRRLTKRKTYGIQFEFRPEHQNFGPSSHGILNWVGTKGMTRGWCNPHVIGAVQVTASSISKGFPLELV